MVAYDKPWLPIEAQIGKLVSRGVEIGDEADAANLLRAVGYYRLTGYLYPFRRSERYDDEGRTRVRVLSEYRDGTAMAHAAKIIEFDRALRILVLDGIERVEVSLRVQLGHTLGAQSPFAHLDSATFVTPFTTEYTDPISGLQTSKHLQWIAKVNARRDASDEAFVAHFRDKYDGQMPIWALTEILELGHLSRLYSGLQNSLATEIAHSYGAPTKRVMASWIASLNYLRNVAAHHARLFNRKLVVVPSRPPVGDVPLLDHLRDDSSAKAVYGVYNALAVTAYLLRTIDRDSGWPERVLHLARTFPGTPTFTLDTMGAHPHWERLELWTT